MSKQTGNAFPIVVGLSVLLVGSGVAQAADSWLGNWKLNVAKSKFSPGPAPKSQISHFEAVSGGAVKITVETVDPYTNRIGLQSGKTIHTEIVTMFDGKEAEYKGAAVPETRAYTRIDDHNFEFVSRVKGKVTLTTRTTVSADGKTRTNVTTGMDADGKPVNNTAVYDRQ